MMDPGPHGPLCDDTSTSREDELIARARRQAQVATPLSPGSDATSLRNHANGSARFLVDAMPGYEPVGEIHRGGQGVVYEAIQRSTRRRVAIKIMRDGPFASAADQARFDREILALAQLKHPNIVAIYESGAAEGRRYFVMDFIHGLPLDEYIVQMRPTQAELIQLFVKVCTAVSAAHDRGIVHRDLKPSNIRVSPDGDPHILDFGLAKLSQPTLESLFEGDSDMRGPAHTVTGQFVGSPPWASPEQARAHHDEIDVRSDVYSLGVILYHLLAGGFPYDVREGGMHAILDRIIHAEPVPLRQRRPKLDADLETIVMKCLEKEPDRRYSSASSLTDDLVRYLNGQPIDARRNSLVYVSRKRVKAWVRLHPVAACFAVIVVSCLIARFAGMPLVYGPSGADAWFEHRALNAMPPTSAPAFDHVRVVSLPSARDIPHLKKLAGLNDIDPDNEKSWRLLHGNLMKKLVGSGVRTVAWDIKFRSATQFDDGFVEGVMALRDAGVDVVIAVKGWGSNMEGEPPVSPHIAPHIQFGSDTCFFVKDVPWRIPLLRQRGDTEPVPSLAMAILAAFRQPGLNATFVLDVRSEVAIISYWISEIANFRAQKWLSDSDRVDLSSTEVRKRDEPEFDLCRYDVVANFLITVPPDAVLRDSTLTYAQVLAASPEKLRDWFSGRVALFGPLDGKDKFDYYDRGKIPGVYGHAVGIESLLTRAAIRRPTVPHRIGWMLLGALIGLGVASVIRGRAWLRTISLASIAVIGTASAIWLTGRLGYLCNPFVYIIAMIASCELAAMVFRARRAAAR